MDATNLAIVRTDFLEAVFSAERTRLKNEMDLIQDKHALRYGGRAFMMDGKPIWNGDAQAAKIRGKRMIDPDLVDHARMINAAQIKLGVDYIKLKQFFSTFEKSLETFQDARDAIPDMVVVHMGTPEIKRLSRTRKEGYLFTSSPIKTKTFGNMCDLMMHYLINRMVF